MITVIVPVYNAEKYLEQCINSILNQTYTDLEILLIDDGSTDSSGVICDQYAQKDSRIKTFHKSNGGVSSARNFGLKRAVGEWIAWVDSDDYIVPEMYDKMLNAASANNADLAYCKFKSGENSRIMPQDDISISEFINQYLFVPINAMWITLCKRTIYENNDICFIEGNDVGEDLLVSTQLYYYATKRVYVQEDLYYYRQSLESISNSIKTSQKTRELINNIFELELFLRKSNLFSQVKASLAGRILFAKEYYLYVEKNISLWYSICPWTRHYIFNNQYNGLKGKIIEWIIVRLYRLCLKLSMVKL